MRVEAQGVPVGCIRSLCGASPEEEIGGVARRGGRHGDFRIIVRSRTYEASNLVRAARVWRPLVSEER
eukprot:1406155-Pyramimonas_sp.AAC.1